MSEKVQRKYIEIGMDYLIETVWYCDSTVTKLWRRIGQDVELKEKSELEENNE